MNLVISVSRLVIIVHWNWNSIRGSNSTVTDTWPLKSQWLAVRLERWGEAVMVVKWENGGQWYKAEKPEKVCLKRKHYIDCQCLSWHLGIRAVWESNPVHECFYWSAMWATWRLEEVSKVEKKRDKSKIISSIYLSGCAIISVIQSWVWEALSREPDRGVWS